MEINKKKIRIADRKKYIVQYRTSPDNDYMKHWRVIRYWATRRYDVTPPELDILFFLYSERLFNYSKFLEFCNIMSWDRARFKTLKDKGFIHVWRKPAWKEIRMYEMTGPAKRMINSIYKKMNREEPIPVSIRRNPIMRPDGKYADKVMAIAILNFNSEVRARQQRLVLE